jgi:hypothetical protein
VKPRLTHDFIVCFRKLPKRIQRLARKNFKLWKRNPSHPGLDFKRVGKRQPAYAVRVGIGWRALGLLQGDTVVWFWIGSHADYDKLVQRM